MVNLCKTIVDYPDATGAMPMLFSIRDCVPLAYPLLLFSFLFVLFAGNYFLIKNKTGRARILVAAVSSSFVMVVISLFFAMAQLVTFRIVASFALIVIVAYIMLVVSDDR